MVENDLILTELQKSIIARMNKALMEIDNDDEFNLAYRHGARDMYDDIGYIVVSEIKKAREGT